MISSGDKSLISPNFAWRRPSLLFDTPFGISSPMLNAFCAFPPPFPLSTEQRYCPSFLKQATFLLDFNPFSRLFFDVFFFQSTISPLGARVESWVCLRVCQLKTLWCSAFPKRDSYLSRPFPSTTVSVSFPPTRLGLTLLPYFPPLVRPLCPSFRRLSIRFLDSFSLISTCAATNSLSSR